MAKNKLVPVQKAIPATKEVARERAENAAVEVWEKAQHTASKTYDATMQSAWLRYNTALRAHKGKSGETDFDKQYDRDREIALKVWKESSEKADRKLTADLKTISR